MLKKSLIFAVLIPFILAAFLARMMTPSPQKAFMKKLANFEKSDNVFYNLTIGDDRFQQYKSNGEYYAKYFRGAKEPVIINTNGGELQFGTERVLVSSLKEDSKAEGSLFWLDKIPTKDVDVQSIVKNNSNDDDSYDVKLNDGTDITVTFYKGVLSRIRYKNVSYFRGLVALDSDRLITGDLLVRVDDFENNKTVPEEWVFFTGLKKISLTDFKAYIRMSDYEVKSDGQELLDLKYAYLGKAIPQEEDYSDESYVEEYSDEEYSEESDSESGHFEYISDDEFNF